MIFHFISTDGKNWDEVVLYALSASHTATRYSPHILLFRQEMRLSRLDDLTIYTDNMKQAVNKSTSCKVRGKQTKK